MPGGEEIYFYFGFDLMIESRRHIVALSNNNKNKNKNNKTLDEF